MNQFYLQFIRHDWESKNREDQICIDDLPFQQLLLQRLVAIGFIEIQNRMLTIEEVEKVRKLLHLRQSLGVNLSGAAIIIELLEKMEEMQNEIERWKHE